MKPLHWKPFEVVTLRGHCAATPALCCFFYLDAYVHAMADNLAHCLEQYVEFVGIDSLKTYAARSGLWKPMNKRQLGKDLQHLRDFPKDHLANHILYDAGEGGQPGGFGVSVSANVHDEIFPDKAGLVRFDLPPDWLERHEAEALIEFVARICQVPEVQSAQVGMTFKTTPGSHSDAKREILQMLPRFYGFSPCDFSLRNEMLGHTLTAHWLNYVNDDLAAKLGGKDSIVKALPECDVRPLSKGVLIRGAKWPPIGDINRQAPDLGCLPAVARLLEPTRVDIQETFLGKEGALDATKWVSRFDDLANRPWDNTSAI